MVLKAESDISWSESLAFLAKVERLASFVFPSKHSDNDGPNVTLDRGRHSDLTIHILSDQYYVLETENRRALKFC